MKLKVYKFDFDMTNVIISYKIDGVQAISTSGVWLSRAGKPLYNLPPMPDGVYEAYLGDWAKSVSAVRTHNGDTIPKEHLYRLDDIDERLLLMESEVCCPTFIKSCMNMAIERGYEGLCVVCDQGHFKIKPIETHDVLVTGMVEGNGKHEGMLGALVTDKGKVGTGFTDAMRDHYWNTHSLVGSMIEVKVMSLTPNGMFRHPVFIRVREDK